MAWYHYIAGDPVFGVLVAMVLLALSGVPGLLIEKPGWGQKIAVAITVVASLMGLGSAVRMIATTISPACYLLSWRIPFGPCELSADPLSTLFLLPLFLVTACCAVFATAYWPGREHPASEKKLTFFFGLLSSAMVLVLMARHGVLLLIAWEIMALSAYFLLTTEQCDPMAQRAGTIYLLATHTGTIFLYVLFALLRAETGTFLFPASHNLTPFGPTAAIILIAALMGFGAKAGIMPLHIWLPGAHANAPSHVSAMMSGVMLKMGIYGILRTVLFFSGLPVWFPWLVLLLGAFSALIGIALAAAQRDMKRLLACSSIENIGIIFIGLGMALIGLQTNEPQLVVLGLVGGFMHLINHGLFKPLLFLGTGVLIHATGTREIDRLGGLARQLPRVTPLFLLGSMAICGLPPLNGFVGELFLYIGAFSEAVVSPTPILALIAPLLAIVGGMAIITFVKLFGMIFLGVPRTQTVTHGHEASAMVVPMALLALLCLGAGVAAPLLLRVVEPAVIFYGRISPGRFADVAGMVPLTAIAVANVALFVLALAVAAIYRRRLSSLPQASAPTWGCGYGASSPRCQYTGTSFSEMAVSLLGVIIAPQRSVPRLAGPLPRASRFGYAMTETIIDRVLTPLFENIGRAFAFVRRLQHGQVHLYMLYIFATLFTMMVWVH